MRIAHVTDCYLPRLGGIEIQVHDLSGHQLRAGHDVQILTGTPGPLDAPLAGDSAPVSRFPGSVGVLPSGKALRGLRRALTGGNFDAVHIHSSVISPFAWAAARMTSNAAIPTVVTMHSVLPTSRSLLTFSDSIGWSRWPVCWSAVSDVAAIPLRGVLGAEAVDVLPNGIDPAHWHSPHPRGSGAELTLVSVMRLSLRKRPLALLSTLAKIRELVPATVPIRAVLVGDGPQRYRMERILRTSGMSSWVTLTGRLTRPEIGQVLSASDVYLAPAERESFGIAALEARCAGLPVIAMAGGGVGEFIRNGEEGFLVGSDDEMARVSADLLMSPQLRTMQEHNRGTVPDLAWPRVVGLSLDLYHRAGALASRSEPLHV